MNLPRPTQHLVQVSRDYTDIWKAVDHILGNKGKSIPNWSPWCFLPLSASYAIVSGGGDNRVPLDMVGEIGRVGALAAWRVGQGIYRFDPTVFECVWDTPLTGNLPVDVLYYLPEYCVYIETPGKKLGKTTLHGFFAHLEDDVSKGHHELRILLDLESGLVSQHVHLVKGASLETCLYEGLREGHVIAQSMGLGDLGKEVEEIFSDLFRSLAGAFSEELSPVVSLLIYLCQTSAEIRDNSGSARPPIKPKSKKTKKGFRVFPPQKPTTWDVGFRTGPALRLALEKHSARVAEAGGTGRAVAPHLRRGHYHHYWTGPKSGPRKLVVHWLHPILVAADDPDKLVPTVRAVD